MNYYIFNEKLYINFANSATDNQCFWIWNNSEAFANAFYSKAKLIKYDKNKNLAKFKLISGKTVSLLADSALYGYIIKDINDKNELKRVSDFIERGLHKLDLA